MAFSKTLYYIVCLSDRKQWTDNGNQDVVQGFEKAFVTCSTVTLELKGIPDNMVETTSRK